MLFSRRTLLASLGLTLPVAAAEAASRHKKRPAHATRATALHHVRAPRSRKVAPSPQS